MRHFFLEIDPARTPVVGDRLVLDREESHHLSTVLRGGRQEILNLVDGRGLRLEARPCGAQEKQEQIEVVSITRDDAELARPQLVLACAVVKGKHFEWAIEKAVELGAHRIVPLSCERGAVDARAGKRDRWATIMKSAMKQSGRSWLPELAEIASPGSIVADQSGGPVLFGAVPGELAGVGIRVESWTFLLDDLPAEPPGSLTLMIGPEGGWTPAERSRLMAGNARPVDLGAHVLRTETAAAVGMFALQTIRRRLLDHRGSSGS